MASPLLPPNPCLVAILLVVNYHHQPRLVFHYPPKPGEDNSHFRTYLSEDLSEDTSSSSSEDESASSEGDRSPAGRHTQDDKNGNNDPGDVDMEELGSASPEKPDEMAQIKKPLKWNDIFGVEAGSLAKLLSPAPSTHKKRFEMTLDEKAFIGWPVFSKDGRWRKKRRRTSQSKNGSLRDDSTLQKDGSDVPVQISSDAMPELDDTSGQDTERDEQNGSDVKHERATSQRPKSKAGSGMALSDSYKRRQSSEEDKSLDTLNMFHVVFVLNPPPLEYHLRIKEMYENVVKKFSRALRWEQARSNYVSKETATIAAAKSIGKSLSADQSVASIYHQILSQSSLAKAISTLFYSISDSKIAQIHLTPTLSLSLQIPIPTSTPVLPGPIDPQMPGLWLTTANALPTDDDVDTTTSQLASHFTLLLLCDLSAILADINATSSPLTEPLTHYLRVSKPTKSFLQISRTSGIPLRDIQFLASHLIYWRRARAIPPLNQRDTYIVSPNADMQKLLPSTSSFAKRFPTLPSLPRMLYMLSYTPRPYSSIFPSKEHKETYLDILAWLLREGWVTQLRTYAFVRVPAHIQELILLREQGSKKATTAAATTTIGTSSSANHSSPSPSPTTNTHNDNDITRPRPRPPIPPSSSPSPKSSPNPPPPSLPANTPPPHLPLPPTPIIIPNPRTPTPLHALYLSSISTHILTSQGPDSHSAWEKCLRYFDGRHALETIAVREGWKRKGVQDLVGQWEEEGVLRRGRWW